MRTTTHTKPLLFSPLLIAAALLGLALAPGLAAGKTQKLFNGKDLAGWRTPTGTWSVAKSVSLDPANPESFVITPGHGVLVNCASGHTVDLISVPEFGDMQAHVEFCITRHSNSGVYLMGRYEMQVYDSFGVENDKYPGIECGGIYPRWINDQNVEGHSPLVNASKPPGQWQAFDITFRAPRFDASGRKIANAKVVKLVHNGKVIQENVELNGPTRGAMLRRREADRPNPASGGPRARGVSEPAGEGD